MDWSKLKNKNSVAKHHEKATSRVLLKPSPSSSDDHEVQQSLLAKFEKSCLVKNDDRKRGDPSRRVRWKDENGNMLVQIKVFEPDFDVYDDSSDDDVDFTDFCNCTLM